MRADSRVCFGLENVSARVLIATTMPAGGLELKQLFAYKMVLVCVCHRGCDQGMRLGTGSEVFGCHLQLWEILSWCFITFTRGVEGRVGSFDHLFPCTSENKQYF